jgi:hypothetical protein
MNNEFKKTQGKDQTVYTLESATSGGTSSGSIASVSTPLGSMQRRNPPGDNILAQEAGKEKEAPKPRNFVAKNAKMGGAGQHKDKKKAEKQGDVKHKNKQMDMAEGSKELPQWKKDWYAKQKPNSWPKHPQPYHNPNWIDELSPEERKKLKGEKGVAEGKDDKIAQLKKDHATAVHWSKNETSPQKREAARQKAEKIKAHLEKQYKQGVAEEWSQKYKSSINCSHPKGFSQKAHCAGKKKHTESMMTMEATCPDCGMCETHGNVNEGLRNPKDNPCWKGYKPVGTKQKSGRTVPNCVPKEGVEEGYYDSGEYHNDRMGSDYGKNNYNVDSGASTFDKERDIGGNNGQPGRPSKLKNISKSLPADPFNRTTGAIPKGKTGKIHSTADRDMEEGFNGEYDDEAGMAQSNLLTTARAVMGLLKTIKDRDNLPEWGQEKIAKAEMMLVSVWDYLQSQKAMGNDPQVDMEEGRNYNDNRTGFSRGPRDDERHDLDVPRQDPREFRMYNLTINGKPLNPQPIMGRDNLIKFGKQQAAAGVDLSNAIISPVKEGVAEGVAETMPMNDAVKVLRQYGADHFKTTSNELHFYKNGQHLSVDLIFNSDATRSVSLSQLNSVARQLKGQGVAEGDAYMESLTNMLERSVSQAQHNLMVGVAHNPQFAQKVKVKQQVGQEFAKADTGRDISKLPVRVPKKK